MKARWRPDDRHKPLPFAQVLDVEAAQCHVWYGESSGYWRAAVHYESSSDDVGNGYRSEEAAKKAAIRYATKILTRGLAQLKAV